MRQLKELKTERWLDKDRLGRLQDRRLAKILDSAGKTLHYRALTDGRSLGHPEDFERIPIISRADIQSAPDSFLNPSSPPFRDTLSSGTSGKPARVFLDREMYAHFDAARLCYFTDFGLTPLDSFCEVTITRSSPARDLYGVFPRLLLPLLGDEAEHLRLIRSHHVNCLRAFPSVIEVLASLNNEAAKPLRMKFVNCGGEALGKGARESIEDSFSTKVFMNYGTSEFGYIAWECPEERSLHVNGSAVLLEIVDKAGRPKKSGTGDIVLTTLRNSAMPLIRYRIGDRGSWGGDCSCGRGWRVLKSLDGRKADVLRLPSGRICPSLKFYFPSRMKSDISGIRQYQVVQREPGLFVFRFVPSGKGPGPECLREIKAKVVQAAGEPVLVEFEETDFIPRGPGGKFRHVIPCRRN
ncbi:MAG TPA: hypothetical protein VLD37_04170 [Candidatus Bilamarchaeum sp.]|nr:hypothetical protein [Candidatus Bilamarchaeum sp.]